MNFFDSAWQWIVSLDVDVITKNLLEGTVVTLQIFFLTLIISVPLGVIVTMLKLSKVKIVGKLTGIYISIMRGTPLMLQIFFIYFFLPRAFSFKFDRFVAVIVAFSINYAAYFAEIFRGGVQSMDRGQYEAASMLGMTKLQTFFRIILPQVAKRVIPAFTNETITLVKDTSLAIAVGVIEMFSLAKKFTSSTGSFVPLIIAGVFYFILNWIITVIMSHTEKKLDYYK